MRSLKIFKTLLIATTLPILAGAATRRYIVELSTEPAAHFAGRSFGSRNGVMARPEVQAQRAKVRTEQASVTTAIRALGGTIVSHTDTASNTLTVDLPEERAASLASISGVKGYHKNRIHRAMLDQAGIVHNFPQVYAQIGGVMNAGAGMKIAMIDTGIDVTQPAFSGNGFTAPAGFPKVNATSDTQYTNGKVIVARAYPSLWVNPNDPDPSAADDIGHGTSTASCAAGEATNAGTGLAEYFGQSNLVGPTFNGAAPGAWLGNYKVFDSESSDGASDAAILAAIDDAVNDGMNVINYSIGPFPPLPPNLDDVAVALNNAVSAGVLVAAAAGNDGDGDDPSNYIQYDSADGQAFTIPGLVSSEGTMNVIAVGASSNQRAFGPALTVGSSLYLLDPEYSITTNANNQNLTFANVPIVDVTTIDGSGEACNPLPAGSLKGAIALVTLNGFDPSSDTCDPDTKMDNALGAGAVAGVMSDNIFEDYYDIDNVWGNYYGQGMGFFYYTNLPSAFITYTDGVALRAQLAGGATTATQDFNINTVPLSSNRVAFLSSRGPSADFEIKPDLVAVGEDLLTAAESTNPNGDFYDPNGLLYPANGTSGSTPLVSGTAAVLMAAVPGLSTLQYRSMIVNSAAPIADVVTGGTSSVMEAGAGLLNAFAALNAEATVSPASVSFGVGDGSQTLTNNITVTNAGANADTFNITVTPQVPGFMPQVSPSSLALAPGASGTITVTVPGGVLSAGEYEGAIHIDGANTATDTHVPYWFGVPSSTPYLMTDMGADLSSYFPRGQLTTAALAFRITDASGIYMDGVSPRASVLSQVTVMYNGTYNQNTGAQVNGNPSNSAPYYLTDTTNPFYSPGVIAVDVTTSTNRNVYDEYYVTIGDPNNPTLAMYFDLYGM